MPTAQSKANLAYYHRRRYERNDEEYGKSINKNRMERYYNNWEKEREYARLYRERKRMEKLGIKPPAEKVEETPA